MSVDYKKKYYVLLNTLNTMEGKWRHERCPIKYLGRNCCGACNIIHQKVMELRKELLREEDETKEMATFDKD